MPTKKRRVMVSVSDDLAFDLATFASATGKPVATVAAELLEEVRPRMRAFSRELSSIMMDRKLAERVVHRLDLIEQPAQYRLALREEFEPVYRERVSRAKKRRAAK